MGKKQNTKCGAAKEGEASGAVLKIGTGKRRSPISYVTVEKRKREKFGEQSYGGLLRCGAHEGLQHLGPYGNIPNIVAELTGDNIPKDFSEDQGYPDPPNPCPVGKTVDDGCLENTPDTAQFSKEFQLHQHLFDPEHDYPSGIGIDNKLDAPPMLDYLLMSLPSLAVLVEGNLEGC
ncbi:UNVERIFIED_CONTAM: hypothetical protein K2H54_047150 [Gekko kuhli]